MADLYLGIYSSYLCLLIECSDALHLESKWCAEGLAALVLAEGEVDVIGRLVVRNDLLSHRDGELEGSGCLAPEALLGLDHSWVSLDRDKVGLLVSEGEGDPLLPWPVGVVEDLEVDSQRGASGDREGLLRLAHDDGLVSPPLLPVTEDLLGPLVLAGLQLLLPLLRLLGLDDRPLLEAD